MALGSIPWAGRHEVLHDLRSVSRSIVGLVYGIALADGKVPPPEAKLYEQFPEYPDLAKQPGRDRLTVGHVLSMTLGMEWDEFTVPYGSVGNSENAMEAAPDRFRFILDRPIVAEPGTKWIYWQAHRARRLGEADDHARCPDRGPAYHWYIHDNMVDGKRQHWLGAIGWGGQRIFAFPEVNLVVAMNCGNYRRTGKEQGQVNFAVLTDVVFPSLT